MATPKPSQTPRAEIVAGKAVHFELWDLDPQAAATYLLRTKAKVKGGSRNFLHGKEVSATIRATAGEPHTPAPISTLRQRRRVSGA